MDRHSVLRLLFCLCLLPIVFFQQAQATVYSDAENGDDGWFVSDPRPPGAYITTVYDTVLQSQVIRPVGDRNGNIYHAIVLYVDTQFGVRRLAYSKSNSDGLKHPNNNYIEYGLGNDNIGAGWFNYERDLARDVAFGEPGNTILSVNGIAVLGDLKLDNITLSGETVPPEPNQPPTATIEASVSSGEAPLNVSFNATKSTVVAPATLTGFAWDFGNGTTASSSGALVTFDQSGSYTVSLQVTDSNGLTDTTSTTITVEPINNPPPVDDPTPPVDDPTPPVDDPTPPVDDPTPVTDEDSKAAARLLAQATFGATLGDIAEVNRLGIEDWVDNQFELQGESQLSYMRSYPNSGSLTGPRQYKWLLDAIDGDDQLRQRVAFAYSEIFVVSDVSQVLRVSQQPMANYYDILLRNAFGNYRDLIEEVTLSPMMGLFLSMLQNAKADPSTNTRADENFAREIMQLFSIGLHELYLDGTPKLGPNGRPIPAYTQQDIEEYARIYTGWSYAGSVDFSDAPDKSGLDQFSPMEAVPGFHDQGQKNLLRNGVSPAGISAEEDLNNALDSLFNHPNVGPFIGKQLIQRLVTSNPTPAYVARVATVFNNNGSGVRGDMRSVIRAILLDPEARSGHLSVDNYGKLREPLLRWTHLWRAFNVQRGRLSSYGAYNHRAPYIEFANDFLGQSVLSSPSVFNFFRPDYAPLGEVREAGLVAPEAQIYSDANILGTTSKLAALGQAHYQDTDDYLLDGSYIDITPETELASDVQALISRLDLLLMSGQMSSGLRSILVDHMNGLPGDEQGRSQRVRDGITLIMVSPEYLVQK